MRGPSIGHHSPCRFCFRCTSHVWRPNAEVAVVFLGKGTNVIAEIFGPVQHLQLNVWIQMLKVRFSTWFYLSLWRRHMFHFIVVASPFTIEARRWWLLGRKSCGSLGWFSGGLCRSYGRRINERASAEPKWGTLGGRLGTKSANIRHPTIVTSSYL